MKKLILIAVVVVVLGTAGWYAFLRNSSESTEKIPVGQVQRVVKVERGDLNMMVSANGVVQPINKVEVRSKAGGQLVEVSFLEGQEVTKGELLLLVDQTTTKNDYDQAKADLEVAASSLTQAENNNRRTTELSQKKLVSEQEVDVSNTELVRAQAQVVKAKANLSNADDRLRDTRIVAPVTGIILSKNVELGQIISSATSNVGGGTLLATVANMEEVYVYTKVDEVDIGRVRVGQKAKVVADAFPEDSFEGQVIRIAPQGVTQQNVTSFDVIVLVRNENAKLKAGMSTSVDIEVFNRRGVLLVANEALKDPKSDIGKVLMAEGNLTLPKDPVKPKAKADAGDGEKRSNAERSDDPGRSRERFQNMSQEEREKYRAQMTQRFANMSEEDREKMRSQFRSRNQQAGGQSGGGMMGGGMPGQGSGVGDGSAPRVKRTSQVSTESDERWKVAMVKDSSGYRPKLVKSGASNFDQTEVIAGLSEGDELQVTSISRAKIAQEEMNQRMRSMGGLGGMTGGGAARGAMGGGGGGRH